MAKKPPFPYAGFKLYVNGKFVKLYSGSQVGMDAAYEALGKLAQGKIGRIERITRTEGKVA